MVRKYPISEESSKAIAEAVAIEEARTSGEIMVVCVPQSGSYRSIALSISAIAALTIPWLLWWRFVIPTFPELWLLQILFFLSFLTLFRFTGLSLLLTPAKLKKRKAKAHARSQFYAQGLHRTKHKNAILIFVSFAEHYAEILADTGIDAKISSGTWQKIIQQLIADLKEDKREKGIIKAVKACGKQLQKYYPSDKTDANELSDVVELVE